MSTMNISLPEAMKDFVDEQVAQGHFGTSSEYVRALIRAEQQKAKLKALLIEGANSGLGVAADEAYYEQLRAKVRKAEKSGVWKK